MLQRLHLSSFTGRIPLNMRVLYRRSSTAVDLVRKSAFESLGIVNSELLTHLTKLGITEPSEIQRKAIPLLGQGTDVVLRAETGSGKTLAYLLPTLQSVFASNAAPRKGQLLPKLAIAVPTQELVRQIVQTIGDVAPSLHPLTRVAYGRLGPTKRDEYSILVGTPLAMQENVSLSQLLEVSMLVIDEADMVLTGSTAEPLTAHLIPQFKSRPNGPLVQYIFSAATLPDTGKKSIGSFIRKYFPGVEYVNTEGVHRPPPTIHQVFMQSDDIDLQSAVEKGDEYLAERDDEKRVIGREALSTGEFDIEMAKTREDDKKWRLRCLVEALASTSCADVGSADSRVQLDDKTALVRRSAKRGSFATSLTPAEVIRLSQRSTLIFTNSVETAIEVEDFLKGAVAGVKVLGLHKKLSSKDREKILKSFQAGNAPLLVCTDVASRGLDTINVEHVIQYEVATDAASYLHRIGRTGRMGRYGRVTTIVGAESERLIGDVLSAMAHDEELTGVFSRRRSLRRSQKKRVERVEEAQIEALNPDNPLNQPDSVNSKADQQ